MYRYFLLVSIVSTAMTASYVDARTDSAPRPNILYFYVDDMGWGAIGPNGQSVRKMQNQPYVLTPNLDRLAAEGINFTRAYGATVCSPARSSQQSGFHQGHTFADRNDPDNARKAMRADDVLMGDVLSRAGYVTGYWGKWGFGGSESMDNPVIENIQTLPTSHGYQYVVAELHHIRAHTYFQPTLWTAPAKIGAVGDLELAPNSMAKYAGNSSYPDEPAGQNNTEYPATAYSDDVYAFNALDFVREQAVNYNATGQPFFGILATQIPHTPYGDISTLPDWNKAYRDLPYFTSLSKKSQEWAAMITRIDAHVGNILDALEDPNGDGDRSDSVADNTLVIFQSDNGGSNNEANKAFNANGGLRGYKGSIYEGAIRIPTIMRWPARITADSTLKAGTESSRVIDVTDLLPTFCDLAASPTPVGIDGVSIAPTLLGVGYQRTRDYVIHEAGNDHSIIRGKYKLIHNKIIFGLYDFFELYDLDADPAEKNDIAADNPDLVKELKNLLIGERVEEPEGFANTYHHWIGINGASTSNPDNWSDYIYANAGTTYLSDKGAPRVSWNAVMENTDRTNAKAIADADVEFLGLEIIGNATATQTLVLAPGVNLNGRNEIRISNNGSIVVEGGTVSSLRWVDVKPGGLLQGSGNIDATLYNKGTVYVLIRLGIGSNYHEFAGSRLNVTLDDKDEVQLAVKGEATLAGELAVMVSPGFAVTSGKSFTILTARKISGSFINDSDLVSTDSGTLFKIRYTPTSVTLTSM